MATTPVGVIRDATAGMGTDLLTVGGIGIAVGAVLFALKKGWRTFKGSI
jgi:hypothetical protein